MRVVTDYALLHRVSTVTCRVVAHRLLVAMMSASAVSIAHLRVRERFLVYNVLFNIIILF